MTNIGGKLYGPVTNGIRTDLITHAADYGLHTKVIRKTADQTLTQSSTTLQNVTELVFAIGASEVWAGILYLRYDSNAAADLKFTFTVPSGATGEFTSFTSGAAGTMYSVDLGTSNDIITSGNDQMQTLHFVAINSTTAGNVQFQAAQNAAHASDSKIYANSCIVATKIA